MSSSREQRRSPTRSLTRSHTKSTTRKLSQQRQTRSLTRSLTRENGRGHTRKYPRESPARENPTPGMRNLPQNAKRQLNPRTRERIVVNISERGRARDTKRPRIRTTFGLRPKNTTINAQDRYTAQQIMIERVVSTSVNFEH